MSVLQFMISCNVPPLQRDGSNLYITLHRHKVDDRHTIVKDGQQPLPVPAGWQIAEGNADDIRVCGAHPWQSNWLVFANGDIYGTAACHLFSSYIGEFRLRLWRRREKFKFLPDA